MNFGTHGRYFVYRRVTEWPSVTRLNLLMAVAPHYLLTATAIPVPTAPRPKTVSWAAIPLSSYRRVMKIPKALPITIPIVSGLIICSPEVISSEWDH